MASICRKISKGRFDVYINLNSPDAVGEIVQSFNMMAEIDNILKFTSHLQTILKRFEKTDQLQLTA